jgi:hypothetical protein
MFPSSYFPATYWPASYYPDPLTGDTVDPDRSRLADIILAIRRKLVADGVVTAANCLSILEDEPFPSPGNPFISVTAGPQRPDFADVEGGGRYLSTFRGEILVDLFLRNQLDRIPEDSSALLQNDPVLGIYTMAKRAFSSLQTYLPADLYGNLLTEDALFCGVIGRPRRYRRDRAWIQLQMPFPVAYYEPLTGDEEYQLSYSP